MGHRVSINVSAILLLVLVTLGVSATVSGGGTGVHPYVDGDWTIDEDTYVYDETIVVNGSLNVTLGARLELVNVTLALNTSGGAWRTVQVDNVSELVMVDTSISSLSEANGTDDNIGFLVPVGGRLTMTRVNLSHVGRPERHDDMGVRIETDSASVTDCIIDSGHVGLYVNGTNGSDLTAGALTISGFTVTDTSFGLLIRNSTGIEVQGIIVEGTIDGLVIHDSIDIDITDTTINTTGGNATLALVNSTGTFSGGTLIGNTGASLSVGGGGGEGSLTLESVDLSGTTTPMNITSGQVDVLNMTVHNGSVVKDGTLRFQGTVLDIQGVNVTGTGNAQALGWLNATILGRDGLQIEGGGLFVNQTEGDTETPMDGTTRVPLVFLKLTSGLLANPDATLAVDSGMGRHTWTIDVEGLFGNDTDLTGSPEVDATFRIPYYSGAGDWFIDEPMVIDGMSINVSGNITVDGVELTLRNTTIRLDSDAADRKTLLVNDSGGLILEDASITSLDMAQGTADNWFLHVANKSTLHMVDSFLADVGWDEEGMYGPRLNASALTFINGTILRSHAGLHFLDGDDIMVDGLLVEDCSFGLVATRTSSGTIYDLITSNVTTPFQLTLVTGLTLEVHATGFSSSSVTDSSRITLTSLDLDNGSTAGDSVGIIILGGDNITIADSTLGNLTSGISATTTENLTILDTTLSTMDHGLTVMDTTSILLERSSWTEMTTRAVVLNGTSSETIRTSAITSEETGVHVLDSTGPTVISDVQVSASDYGMIIENGSDGRVLGADIVDSGYGLYIMDCSDISVEGSTVTDSQVGLFIDGSTDITVSTSGFDGNVLGIQANTDDSSFSGNTLTGNTRGAILNGTGITLTGETFDGGSTLLSVLHGGNVTSTGSSFTGTDPGTTDPMLNISGIFHGISDVLDGQATCIEVSGELTIDTGVFDSCGTLLNLTGTSDTVAALNGGMIAFPVVIHNGTLLLDGVTGDLDLLEMFAGEARVTGYLELTFQDPEGMVVPSGTWYLNETVTGETRTGTVSGSSVSIPVVHQLVAPLGGGGRQQLGAVVDLDVPGDNATWEVDYTTVMGNSSTMTDRPTGSIILTISYYPHVGTPVGTVSLLEENVSQPKDLEGTFVDDGLAHGLSFTISQNVTVGGPDLDWSVDGTAVTVWSNTTDAFGLAYLDVTVTNPWNGRSSVLGLPVDVINVPDAPTLASISDVAMVEDGSDVRTTLALDGDGDSLTLTLTPWPGFIEVTGNGDPFTLDMDPTIDDIGTYLIEAVVSDGQLTANRTFMVSVMEVDDPPVLTVWPDTSLIEGQGYAVTLEAWDEEGHDILWNVTIDDPVLTWMPETHTLSGGFDDERTGTVNVSVNLTSNGTTAWFNSTVTLVPTDDPPSCEGWDPDVKQGEEFNTCMSILDEEGDVFNITVDAPDFIQVTVLSPGHPESLCDEGPHVVFSGTPDNDDVGTYTITVYLEKNGVTWTHEYVLGVNDTNDHPIPPSPQEWNPLLEDSFFTHTFPFLDPDGDQLSFSYAGLPGNLTGTTDGTVAGTPTQGDVGVHDISVYATDGRGGDSEFHTIWTVVAVDDPPEWLTLDLVDAIEDGLYLFVVNAVDEEGASVSYSAVSLPDFLSFDGNRLSGTPGSEQVGDHSVTIDASDGSKISTMTWTLTVIDRNDMPIYDLTAMHGFYAFGEGLDTFNAWSDPGTLPYSSDGLRLTLLVEEGETLTIPMGDWFTDEETSVAYSLPYDLPWYLSLNSTSGDLVFHADEPYGTLRGPGTSYTFTDIIRAEDGGGMGHDISFNFNFTEINDPPILVDPGTLAVTEDALFTIDLDATDADDEETPGTWQNITFEMAQGYPWMSIDDTTGMMTGTPPTGGQQTIVVVVSNEDGTSTELTLDLEVTEVNDLPMVSMEISDIYFEDEEISLSLNVSDEESVDLTYSVSTNAGWLVFDEPTVTFTGTPGDPDVGIYTLNVDVTDGDGGTTTFIRTFKVERVNDRPVITLFSDITVDEEELVEIPLTVVDEEGDPIDTVLAGTCTFLEYRDMGSHAIITGTPDDADIGTCLLTIMASDDLGNEARESINVTVTAIDDPPVIHTASLPDAEEDSPFTFTFEVTDVDSATVILSLEDGPPGMTLEGMVYSGTPSEPGSYVLKVRALSGPYTITRDVPWEVADVDDVPVAIIISDTTDLNPGGTFIGRGNSSVDEGALSYLWQFGDGQVSYLSNVEHVYRRKGSYQVNLTVLDISGQSNTVSVQVNVHDPDNQVPIYVGGLEDIHIEEGYPLELDLTDHFFDGDSTLTFASSDLDLQPSTGGIVILETDMNGGTVYRDVVFSASDGESKVLSPPITITILERNLSAMPVNLSVVPVLDDTIHIDQGTGAEIGLDIVDVNGNALNVTVSASPDWVELSTSILRFDGVFNGTRRLTLTVFYGYDLELELSETITLTFTPEARGNISVLPTNYFLTITTEPHSDPDDQVQSSAFESTTTMALISGGVIVVLVLIGLFVIPKGKK